MAKAQAARTHCPAGHPYDETNTSRTRGRRVCKTCTYARWREAHPPTRGILPTTAERLWALFERQPNGCWRWTRKLNPHGYGTISIDGRTELAHRAMYELIVGVPIGATLTGDHRCHNEDTSCPGGDDCPHRACVNPSHLVPATIAENVMRGQSPPARNARKTHCPKGHPYDEANTYVNPNTGWRLCRACKTEYWKTYRPPNKRRK